MEIKENCQDKSEVEVVFQCRLCGKTRPLHNAYNIANSQDLVFKMRKLLPVVVIVGDPLPQEVCHKCKRMLDVFNAFYDLTKKTEKSLKCALKFIPNEQPPVTDTLIHFNDIFGPIMKHICQKEFDQVSKPSPKERLVEKTLNKTKLYSCIDCKRTWVSKNAALSHQCNSRISNEYNDVTSETETNKSAVESEVAKEVEKNTDETFQSLRKKAGSNNVKVKKRKKIVGEIGREESNNNQTYSVKPSISSTGSCLLSALEKGDTTNPEPECSLSLPTIQISRLSEESSKEGRKTRQSVRRPKRPRCSSVTDEELAQWKSWKGQWTGKPDESLDLESEPLLSQFECECCGKAFAYKAELTLHSAVHVHGSDGIGYDSVTAFDFIDSALPKSSSGVAAHDNSHPCSFCELTFKRKATLISHVQTHIEKSFDVSWSDDGT